MKRKRIPATREEAELLKLQMECESMELNNKVLRNKLNPELFNSASFTKTIQFILTHASGISTGLGSACFAIASGLYANGVTSQYCEYTNRNLRDACNTGSMGLGLLVASTGFFAMSKMFHKFNTPTNDESSTHTQKLD